MKITFTMKGNVEYITFSEGFLDKNVVTRPSTEQDRVTHAEEYKEAAFDVPLTAEVIKEE